MERKKLARMRNKLKASENSNRVLLLVDLSHTFHVGWHTHSDLTYKGRITAGIYGFILMLTSKIRMSGATHVLVCKDRKPYLRSKIYPAYKANRETASTVEDKIVWRAKKYNMVWCEDLLDACGIPTIALKGYEADDLVGAVVKMYASNFRHIYILSGDTDLYQLFYEADNVSFLKRSAVYSKSDFKEEYSGIDSLWQWLVINAMTGGHNNLPKVKGVGIKTAIKTYNDKAALADFMQKHKDLINLNIELMRLPYNETVCCDLIKEKGAIGKVLHPLYRFEKFKYVSSLGVRVTQGMSESLNQLRLGAK